MQENLTNESLSKYVAHFCTRLSRACELARENHRSSQCKMKRRYDQNTVKQDFKSGDQVLVFLPTPEIPLKSNFMVPMK